MHAQSIRRQDQCSCARRASGAEVSARAIAHKNQNFMEELKSKTKKQIRSETGPSSLDEPPLQAMPPAVSVVWVYWLKLASLPP